MTRPKLPPLFVAEDSADDLFFFTRLLNKAGILNPLHIVLDGEEGIAMLERAIRRDGIIQPPLVAFIDLKMPKVGGFELLAWIRNRAELDDVPVVIMSSSTEARDVTRAGKLGAQYYFAKYPSELTLARVLSAASRFPLFGGKRRVHHVPGSLLPDTDGPLR